MKIVSYNVNGIRSSLSKGLKEWVVGNDADIYCIQELKLDSSLHNSIREVFNDYDCQFFSAQKKGYSGVAIISEQKPIKVEFGCNVEAFDYEGRVILNNYGNFAVLNAYYPSGSNEDRQCVKDDFLNFMSKYLLEMLKLYPNLIHLGDFNICHTELDIHNPKRHIGVSGFLPHERNWFSDTLKLGFHDAFRLFDKNGDNYTWWSYRSGAKQNNLGWRIDYHWVSDQLKEGIKMSKIHNQVLFSDHCPIEIELDLS